MSLTISNQAKTLSGTPNVLEYCNNSNITMALLGYLHTYSVLFNLVTARELKEQSKKTKSDLLVLRLSVNVL